MVIRYLWLLWLPLLFLPNLGTENQTPFGTLTISDYLVFPYFLLLILSLPYLSKGKPYTRTLADLLAPTLTLFVFWAVISTITMSFRYSFPDQGERQIIFGVLKIGKLGLYGVAGILTIRALSLSAPLWGRRYDWVLTVIGLLIGITLLVSGNDLNALMQGVDRRWQGQVFQENPVSVLLAILIVFLIARIIDEDRPSAWRTVTIIVLAFMTLGFVFAEGRGGWLAALIGVGYVFFRRTTGRTLQTIIAGMVIILFAYDQFPRFRELVDLTLQPDPAFLQQYNMGVFGLDDGARLIILQTEAPKVVNSPVFGTGFFHRGGLSGIFGTGSHNFFLQMFLETGIPGGVLVLILVRQMWRHASLVEATGRKSALATKAALVTAFVSALSGEYFYGGTVLLIFWLTYAPVGAQVIEPTRHTAKHTIPVANQTFSRNQKLGLR